MNIGFIGLGKLGLDCAEVFAEKYTVRGYDIYPRTSDRVKVCSIEETVNESDWIFDLDGSAAVSEAFIQCVERMPTTTQP